jgi:tetratricopeptide (TPR) repeat protein
VNFVATALLCLLARPLIPLATAQHRPAHNPQTADPAPFAATANGAYLSEPYVIEEYNTTFRFENDGRGERRLAARIRIQNDAAAKQFSELSFDFDANTEELTASFVRVRKPDGTAIDAGPEAITEETASAVRDAPAYANARQKRIAVPPLQPGEVLEYEIVTRVIRPKAASEFWAQHAFLKNAIILDERLEISVPQGRSVTIRSANFPYSTDAISSKGRVIYRWKHSNLALPADDNESQPPSQAKITRQPDIQLTTFTSWGDVSRWYAKIARNSTEPTPEIRAKAAELIANSSTELDKIQALYEYVARTIRYVDSPFGAGGFAPHSAAEVFKNQYGDAKDKHALLAAMLQAAGVNADAVLVPQSQKLDISSPSPSQFGHVITRAAYGSGIIWMDSAPEVAPFEFLSPSLRHKAALLVTSDGTGKIVETPADPPFLSTQRVEVEGRVSDLGKLAAHIHYQIRGDNEFVLRLAFRRTPASQWRDLGQTILTLDGVHGDVTLAKSSDPLDTRQPFEVDLEYAQSNFLDWSSKKAKVALPLLSIGTPDAPKSSAQPIALGSPLDVATRLKLLLPSGFVAETPVGIAVTRDYAEFKSSYRFLDRTLTAQRSLDFKMRGLPASRRGDYLAFTHALDADQAQPLVVENSAPGMPVVPPEATASDLFDAGSAALAAANPKSAIPLLERAVALEPAHKEAWNDLGLAHLRLAHFDRAAAAFEKQLQVNPSDAHAHNYLGLAFEQQQKYDEAAAAFRQQIEIDPLDTVAHAALGTILLAQHQYFEAVPELDKATVLSPRKAELQISLGQAYINLGQNGKAAEAFDRAAEISPTAAIWNNAAYNLADHKVELAKAQKYAEYAVSATAADLAKIDLAHVTSEQIAKVASMGNYWDTLGWVYFQKGDLDSAERYIRAAWLLDQHGEIADHLAQIHEKHGKKDEAIRTYALALAAPHSNPDTRARLTLLLGGNAQINELVQQAAPALIRLRTLPAGKLFNEDAQAEFAILLSPGKIPPNSARVEAVRFLVGNEKLRAFADRLRSLDYGPLFPDASPVKLVRRGTLSCSAAGAECSFILHLGDEPSTNN